MFLPLLPLFLATLDVAQSHTTHHSGSSSHASRSSAFPTVTTSDGSSWIGRTALGVDSFKGLPFAKPPTGDLRFAPPQKLNSTFPKFDASAFGKVCPEMWEPQVLPENILTKVTNFNEKNSQNPILQGVSESSDADWSEDCLTLNIFRPAGLNSTAGLPILFWIYPGGFFFGSSVVYDGTAMVARSVELGQPVIFIAANHRTNSFGFMPGAEIQADATASVNAGLYDQRMALEWVSQYIENFGGDGSKTTIFGLSSGAISAGFQLEAFYGNITSETTGKPLFRGAIMQSGSPVPVGVTSKGQNSFDVISGATGCSNSTDKVACLRAVPFADLLRATNLLPTIGSYHSAALSFLPRVDGEFLSDRTDPWWQQESTRKVGREPPIPIISGDQADEGTLLCVLTQNITTEANLAEWLSTIWFPTTDPAIRKKMLALYPADPRYANVITPQNKRINALIGDLVFQGPRRGFVNATSQTQPTWSYSSTVAHLTPFLGSFHSNDVLGVPLGIAQGTAAKEMRDRWISFANTLQPNLAGYRNWPTYGSNGTLLAFTDGDTGIALDNYREEAIGYLVENMGAFAL
ncbi:hypothetical protein RQP46_001954 [Phenoliferia psychrophenolica]